MKYPAMAAFLLHVTIAVAVLYGHDKSAEKRDCPCFQDRAEKQKILDGIRPGEFRSRRIAFIGNITLHDRELRKNIAFEEGDLFTIKVLYKSIEGLNRMKKIYPVSLKNVKITLSTESKSIDTVFCVKERSNDD
ncbi:MAG: hypothetical protein HKN25_05445 [Pyrinomonadaceae bacterium]|nr:hypothetical protein [Pyrinomonadaceae bacterium]